MRVFFLFVLRNQFHLIYNQYPSPHPQSHSLSNNEEKPTRFEDGLSSALPTNGPEPNQLVLVGAAEGGTEGLELGVGRLFVLEPLSPLPGAVSLHCCQSQAKPSRIGRRGAGGGGGSVVVRLAFGVTTTWFSKAYEVIVRSKMFPISTHEINT